MTIFYVNPNECSHFPSHGNIYFLGIIAIHATVYRVHMYINRWNQRKLHYKSMISIAVALSDANIFHISTKLLQLCNDIELIKLDSKLHEFMNKSSADQTIKMLSFIHRVLPFIA